VERLKAAGVVVPQTPLVAPGNARDGAGSSDQKLTSPAVTVAPTVSEPVANFLGEDWVQAQKPNYYTLQILGSFTAQDLKDYARQHGLSGDLAIMTGRHQGRPWYTLIYGAYRTHAAAQQARAVLPVEVVRAGSQVRRFHDLR
jgi:DamX protein